MPSIAIIDDRSDQRDTIKNLIELSDIGSWEVISEEPLTELEDYISWIIENDISVILLDEKLNETDTRVGYNGHELVDLIRSRIPTLPIFVITSFKDDEEVLSRFKEVEAIIERQEEFIHDPEKFIPRFIRSGQKFTEANLEELDRLSTIAKRIVTQEASPEEIKEAEAVKQKLSIAFDIKQLTHRSELINNLEAELEELNSLKDKIKTYLERKDNVAKDK
jgi:CheY-like chemotaxis protein